jgi:hypothetical protein
MALILLKQLPVASKKSPVKTDRPPNRGAAEKPIRLADLIPTRNVTGGRSAVFGSAPTNKRKPSK